MTTHSEKQGQQPVSNKPPAPSEDEANKSGVDKTGAEKSQANKPEANKPKDEDDDARHSGQLGADKPRYGQAPDTPQRPADKRPNAHGPEYEEGGAYPGKRPGAG